MKNEAKHSGWSFSSVFLVGGIIGAVAGILVAPKAGSEIRSSIRENTSTLRSRARERIGPAAVDMRQRLTPVAEKVSSRFGRRAGNGTEEGEVEGDLAAALVGDAGKTGEG